MTSEPACQCRVEGCHCDGIIDLAEHGFDRCACCLADCPNVHDEPSSGGRNGVLNPLAGSE